MQIVPSIYKNLKCFTFWGNTMTQETSQRKQLQIHPRS